MSRIPVPGPNVGDPAPLLDLPTAAGERCSLSALRGRPVFISFLGPAHCQFCRAHVIRAIQARGEFARIGADVIFVAFHDPELLMSKMLRDLELPYMLIVDPTRAVYRQWGLGQAGLSSILRPGLYWNAFKMALRREPSLGRSPDPGQLGGDFVVDRTGRLAYVHRLKSFYDRAAMADLVDVLARA